MWWIWFCVDPVAQPGGGHERCAGASGGPPFPGTLRLENVSNMATAKKPSRPKHPAQLWVVHRCLCRYAMAKAKVFVPQNMARLAAHGSVSSLPDRSLPSPALLNKLDDASHSTRPLPCAYCITVKRDSSPAIQANSRLCLRPTGGHILDRSPAHSTRTATVLLREICSSRGKRAAGAARPLAMASSNCPRSRGSVVL